MKRYGWLHVLVIGFPLALSFDSKVHFYTRWPALFVAILVVGIPYLVWDAIFAHAGHWGFNHAHVGRFRLFRLPLEEILFFVTVPYACLFILEVVGAYLEPIRLGMNPRLFLIPAALLLLLVWFVRRRPYTMLASASVGLFLAITVCILPSLLLDGHFWIYLAVTYLPFLVVNGVLTAIPIVTYSPEAILGPRVTSIPVEDFFYSLSLLGFEALAFRLASSALGG